MFMRSYLLLDYVSFFQCEPCLDACDDPNMRCNPQNRVCICIDGFKLDTSGKRCTRDDHTLTELDCESNAQCNRIPNARCNQDIGEPFSLYFYIIPVICPANVNFGVFI